MCDGGITVNGLGGEWGGGGEEGTGGLWWGQLVNDARCGRWRLGGCTRVGLIRLCAQASFDYIATE